MSAFEDVLKKATGRGLRLAIIAALVALTSCAANTDPTEGVDYRAGDQPQEVSPRPGCAMSGGCPTLGFKWKIPAAGAVETEFDLDAPRGAALRGNMSLSARVGFGWLRTCPAVVEWVITVDDRSIVRKTLSAGNPIQPVKAALPSDAKTATLTVRRTDSEPCEATLHWQDARLG